MAKQKPQIVHTLSIDLTSELFDEYVNAIIDTLAESDVLSQGETDADEALVDFGLTCTDIRNNAKVLEQFKRSAQKTVLEDVVLDRVFDNVLDDTRALFKSEINKANKARDAREKAAQRELVKNGVMVRIPLHHHDHAVALLQAAGLLDQ